MENLPNRPLSPNVKVYAWSWPMVASITHRISGVVLVLFVPLYLWLFSTMVGSAQGFRCGVQVLHSFWGGLLLWLVGTALLYHFCNGIRFLLLDAAVAEQREQMLQVARWPLLITAGGSIFLAAALIA
ncbi:MAG: succinate dehydrogenase, cytochrome b556 subunit [Mariprofundales bacterium]|nr:succinate dehydrogenase, cytochrome b556 subunit [Mariprofundales bacterium]